MERLAWEFPPPEILSFEDDPFPTIQGSPHLLQSSVMPVVVCRPGEVIQIGTCFSISASGILVTADHVFLEGMEIMGHTLPERVSTPEPKTYQLSDDDWRLSALYSSNIMPKGTAQKCQGGFLDILRAWRRPEADLCLLFPEMRFHKRTREPIPMPPFKLSPGIPAVSQLCFGLGYHSPTWSVKEDSAVVHVRVDQTFSASKGEVEEIHFPIRDRLTLPYPTFRTNARFERGMSGGPILDTCGRVLGVITRGFGKDLDSGMYTEYGILAGILLTIEVEYSHFGEKRCGFLADLQRAGMVEFDETLTGIKITRESERTSFDYGSGRVLTVRGSWNV